MRHLGEFCPPPPPLLTPLSVSVNGGGAAADTPWCQTPHLSCRPALQMG